MKNKNLISKLNIIFAIVLFAFAIVFVFVEPRFFAIWINKQSDAGLEGLGVLALIALGIYCAAGVIITGILNLVSGITIKKANSIGKEKAWSIVSVVVDFITAAIFVYWLILVIGLYTGGIVTKIIYAIMALASIGLAVLQIVSLSKKTPKTEEIIVEE